MGLIPGIDIPGHTCCIDPSAEICNIARHAPLCSSDSCRHDPGLLAGAWRKRPCRGSARSPRSSLAQRRRDPTRSSFVRSSRGAWASPRCRGYRGSRPRSHHRQESPGPKAEPEPGRAFMEGLPRVLRRTVLDPRTCTSVQATYPSIRCVQFAAALIPVSRPGSIRARNPRTGIRSQYASYCCGRSNTGPVHRHRRRTVTTLGHHRSRIPLGLG